MTIKEQMFLGSIFVICAMFIMVMTLTLTGGDIDLESSCLLMAGVFVGIMCKLNDRMDKEEES